MIKLYGTARSRAARCLWALEEAAVKYEHLPVGIEETRSPWHLRLNPNGHIPVLEDDGTVLWESMAINLYIAEKYGKALWPASAEDRGRAYQWSFWAMTEIEPHLMTLLRQRLFVAPDQRDEHAIRNATDSIALPLKVLDDHLKGRDHILGKSFTIADLNPASVLSLQSFAGLDLGGFPAAKKWLETCLAREAYQRARAMK